MSLIAEHYLKKMKNQKIDNIGRAADLIWIGMGDLVEVEEYKGGKVLKNMLALHIQCPWRLFDFEQKILLASSDIYQPNSSSEWNADFDYDIQGGNLFDEKAKKYLEVYPFIYVEEVNFNTKRDLNIVFSNGDTMETFTDYSGEEECWRFFEMSNDNPHLVSYGNHMSF